MTCPRHRLHLILIAMAALIVPGVRSAADAQDRSDFVLTTNQYKGADFEPAFIGNGYLGGRIAFEGQGAGGDSGVTAQVQGLYALDRMYPWLPVVERRAPLPIWSRLEYNDGSGTFGLDR